MARTPIHPGEILADNPKTASLKILPNFFGG